MVEGSGFGLAKTLASTVGSPGKIRVERRYEQTNTSLLEEREGEEVVRQLPHDVAQVPQQHPGVQALLFLVHCCSDPYPSP